MTSESLDNFPLSKNQSSEYSVITRRRFLFGNFWLNSAFWGKHWLKSLVSSPNQHWAILISSKNRRLAKYFEIFWNYFKYFCVLLFLIWSEGVKWKGGKWNLPNIFGKRCSVSCPKKFCSKIGGYHKYSEIFLIAPSFDMKSRKWNLFAKP
jgi:hypothetical protein